MLRWPAVTVPRTTIRSGVRPTGTEAGAAGEERGGRRRSARARTARRRSGGRRRRTAGTGVSSGWSRQRAQGGRRRGSGKARGSRWSSTVGSIVPVPAGSVVPPTANGSRSRRTTGVDRRAQPQRLLHEPLAAPRRRVARGVEEDVRARRPRVRSDRAATRARRPAAPAPPSAAGSAGRSASSGGRSAKASSEGRRGGGARGGCGAPVQLRPQQRADRRGAAVEEALAERRRAGRRPRRAAAAAGSRASTASAGSRARAGRRARSSADPEHEPHEDLVGEGARARQQAQQAAARPRRGMALGERGDRVAARLEAPIAAKTGSTRARAAWCAPPSAPSTERGETKPRIRRRASPRPRACSGSLASSRGTGRRRRSRRRSARRPRAAA